MHLAVRRPWRKRVASDGGSADPLIVESLLGWSFIILMTAEMRFRVRILHNKLYLLTKTTQQGYCVQSFLDNHRRLAGWKVFFWPAGVN